MSQLWVWGDCAHGGSILASGQVAGAPAGRPFPWARNHLAIKAGSSAGGWKWSSDSSCFVTHFLRRGMCLHLSPKVYNEGHHSRNEESTLTPRGTSHLLTVASQLLTVQGREVGTHLLANNSIVIVSGESDQQMLTSELSVVSVGVRRRTHTGVSVAALRDTEGWRGGHCAPRDLVHST